MVGLASPITLATSLADKNASLEKSRAALFNRYGSVPLASVDWVMKAPIPSYVFHLEGAEPLKVTINAATSEILTVEQDGEGWVLRLHTGEIAGDSGKFLGLAWGLALTVMTITGIVLYLQMLRSRSGRSASQSSGWRRYFW